MKPVDPRVYPADRCEIAFSKEEYDRRLRRVRESMAEEYRPAFPPEEYEARLLKVREHMAEDDLDLLLVTFVNNACYLTGYKTPLSDWHVCIAVPREGNMVAHVLDLEEVSLFMHGRPKDAPCYSVHWYHKDRAPLQAGMTFHSPHGYRDKNRKVGVMLSETWVVTENGGEVLDCTHVSSRSPTNGRTNNIWNERRPSRINAERFQVGTPLPRNTQMQDNTGIGESRP